MEDNLNHKIQLWQLKYRQNMPLWMKEEYTKKRIINWYEHWDGKVYVSFSGGKDSTVLLHQVRRLYPDVPAVFSDTGLEYPEIREFVKTIENVIWIRPKMNFKEVIEKYGYPVISKEVSSVIHTTRNKPNGREAQKFNPDSEYIKKYGLRYCIERYVYLLNAPFKIHSICCDILKKHPFKLFHKQTSRYPILGTMAHDSAIRRTHYLKSGCNAFESKKAISNPIAFWNDIDIWGYIKKYNVQYSKIYNMGNVRTGCMFCMFGVHLEKQPNRFQRMQITHPKQYDFCINKLGLGEVLDYIKVPYVTKQEEFDFNGGDGNGN